MSHDYSNLSNVSAGEKDQNVIREIVREIAERRKKAHGQFGYDALVHDFHMFTGFESGLRLDDPEPVNEAA